MSDDETPRPKLSDTGFPIAPFFYGEELARFATAVKALNALGAEDPTNQIDAKVAGAAPIALWHRDDVESDDDAPPMGWLMLVDQNCWAFVPYVPEIEAVSS